MYKNKKLLIVGGTGSFGNAVLGKLLKMNLSEIRIFSRDEKKQDDMRKKYNNDKIKFFIGNVRDYRSVLNAVRGVDFIFHAAALKQVPSCEFYPIEAVKTNILGTENILEAAIAEKVKKVVCLSTDKAVYPINAMGISKAMMEKVALAKSRNNGSTVICITRYGNVMGSRGSVIPLFIDQILSHREITITDPEMTRFMMSLDNAVELVMYAFENGKNGEIFVQKSPAATIKVLYESLIAIFEAPNHKMKIIGTRHGEKLHEVLLSREELLKSKDLGKYYCVSPDNRDLNYDKYFDKGEKSISNMKDYNSNNTIRLDVKKMKKMLLDLDFITKSI
tara:strand:+ start:617 stop:1618 length:1002 start_codon:yes stop_codon:yes gene_type:complete